MGTILVLNGPSSAGKTTLARAVQARLGVSAAAVSLDQFFGFMHPKAKINWAVFAALSDAAFATAAALANGGFHVVVDTVFERAESAEAAKLALMAHAHHFIAVTCELAELEAREARRGDRRIGQARDQYTRVLHEVDYALRVDTSRLSVDECVTQIVGLL